MYAVLWCGLRTKCGKPSKQTNNNIAPNWTNESTAHYTPEKYCGNTHNKDKTPIKSKPLDQMQSNWEFKSDIEIPTNPDNFIRIAQGIHPCTARFYVPKFTVFWVPHPALCLPSFAHKSKRPFLIISYCQYSVVSKKTFHLRPSVTSTYMNWLW